SSSIRDNVMESLSGVQGDNSVKIFGPDLRHLEDLAYQVKNRLEGIRGIGDSVGIYRIMGQSNLEFRVDRKKCARWGINVADVNNVIDGAVRGRALTQMIEGEKTFDVTPRWPAKDRQDLSSILEIPVDVIANQVTAGSAPGAAQSPFTGASAGRSSYGLRLAAPGLAGSGGDRRLTRLLPPA